MYIKTVNAVEILKRFAVVVGNASSFFLAYVFNLFDEPNHSTCITITSVTKETETCMH